MLALDHLYFLLQKAIEHPELNVDDETKLRIELEKHRNDFVNLLQFPTQSPAERKELDQGIFRPENGQVLRVNEEFRKEAYAISQEINLSENRSAEYLSAAFDQHNRIGHTVSDTAILLYFEDRVKLLECVELIMTNSVCPVVSHFADELAASKTATSSSFCDRILSQIDQLAPKANPSC